MPHATTRSSAPSAGHVASGTSASSISPGPFQIAARIAARSYRPSAWVRPTHARGMTDGRPRLGPDAEVELAPADSAPDARRARGRDARLRRLGQSAPGGRHLPPPRGRGRARRGAALLRGDAVRARAPKRAWEARLPRAVDRLSGQRPPRGAAVLDRRTEEG